MRTSAVCSRLRRRRASALIVTLVMLTVITMGSLWMMRSVLDQKGLNKRRRELARAYYIAEGGVDLVTDWGNNEALFTPDPTLFAPTNDYQKLKATVAANPNGYVITSSMLDNMGFDKLVAQGLSETPEYQFTMGRVKEIVLLPKQAGDPAATMFKVRSTGRSQDGVERTVTACLKANYGVTTITLPAALISYNVAAAFGNARIHWGEAWSKNNFTMLPKSQMDYLIPSNANYDPDAIYKTEGVIIFPASWGWGWGDDLFDWTRSQVGAAPASGQYANAFYQRLAPGILEWPKFDYLTFKNMAISNGRYYSTDAAGNIYRSGIEDAAHKINFWSEFGVSDRATAPYDLVFIDTVNGNPPASDNSNLATISVSGNSKGLKGVFWIGANFNGSGIGSPLPVTDAKDPDGNPPPGGKLDKIFLEGVLYAAGTVALSGNAGVYGSIVANRGFAGGGTPDIWYNVRLADGLELRTGAIGARFTIIRMSNS